MARTTSSIISNLLSSLERLSQFMPTFSSPDASSSSSIAQEDVNAAEVNSIQKRLMEDLSRLPRMMRIIQAVIHDAEEREINEKVSQLWLSELREVACDVEDVLDQYDYQVIKIQVEGIIAAAEAQSSLKEPTAIRAMLEDQDSDDDSSDKFADIDNLELFRSQEERWPFDNNNLFLSLK